MSEDKGSDQFQPEEQAFVARTMAHIINEAASASRHPEDFERLLTALAVSLLERVKAAADANWFENKLRREAVEANPLSKKFLDEG